MAKTNQYKNDHMLDEPGVDPIFAHKMKAVMSDLRGHGAWMITAVLRTKERQRYLYSMGRSAAELSEDGFDFKEVARFRKQGSKASGKRVTNTLKSKHIDGVACDVVPIVNGAPSWDVPAATWALVGSAAKAHGLTWGGSWTSFVDRPHVQLS